MRRQLIAAVLVSILGLAFAGVASANPWPDFNALGGSFPCTVTATQTATGWDYVVQVDPDNERPGWGIKAFVVYPTNVTTQESTGWSGYDGGNTAGWTNTNGSWEQDKVPGTPPDTSAAFGWQTGSDLIMSGDTATFHAIDLPSGFEDWNQNFVVHAVPPDGAQTFWAETDGGGGPEETPEPGTLLLLSLGLGATVGAVRRRRSS